jgi:hypothetical protein
VWGIFYEGGPRVRRPLKEWSGIAEKFEKRWSGESAIGPLVAAVQRHSLAPLASTK